MVAYPVDRRGGHLVVPEHGRPAAGPRFVVTAGDRLPWLSDAARDRSLAPSASRGYPSSPTTTILARATCASSRPGLPSDFARRSLATSDDAARSLAPAPSEHASRAGALAMCVFPVPTSPTGTRSSRRPGKDGDPGSGRPRPPGNETGAQSHPSNVSGAGSAAARRGLAPRDASREDTSASRWPRRYSPCRGVPASAHSPGADRAGGRPAPAATISSATAT